jgi:hypothetical protein
MSWVVKLPLSFLGGMLIIGVVAVIGMANGEAPLPAGQELAAPQRRKKRQAQAVALVSVIGLLIGGKIWWNNQQARAEQTLYRPAAMQAQVQGDTLTLTLGKSGWFRRNRWMVFCPITTTSCIYTLFAGRVWMWRCICILSFCGPAFSRKPCPPCLPGITVCSAILCMRMVTRKR